MLKYAMPTDCRPYLEEMLDVAQKLLAAADTSLEQFAAEWLRTDAVRYNFIKLGMVVERVPKNFATEHPEIPWRKLANVRNVHVDTLWDIIHTDIKELTGQLQRLLQET